MTERARNMSAGLRWMRFEDPDVILEYFLITGIVILFFFV